jgi:hypothetical protein
MPDISEYKKFKSQVSADKEMLLLFWVCNEAILENHVHQNLLEGPTNASGFMNAILLHTPTHITKPTYTHTTHYKTS